MNMNTREEYRTQEYFRHRLAPGRICGVLSLILAIILIAGQALPALAADEPEASAGGSGTEASMATEYAAEFLSTAADTEEPVEVQTEDLATGIVREAAGAAVQADGAAKELSLSGYDVRLKTPAIIGSYLGSTYFTDTLKARGYSNYIKLTWSAVKSRSKISGYIILRKDKGQDTWTQIGTAGKKATSYKDKTAKVKNTYYQYAVLSYVKKAGNIKVSKISQWAGAVTTKSSKKNVYSVSNASPARTSALSVGVSSKISLKFPSKAYTKTMRWKSSNKGIAVVDDKGVITGTGVGTATITGRTHTGSLIKIKVKVIKAATAQSLIDVMRSWMGYSRLNGKYKGIIDIYNSQDPLPVGYTMKYSDAWCAASLTAASVMSGNLAGTGAECSVDRFVKMYKDQGRWLEGSNVKPKKGDFIVYNWLAGIKNKNYSHIGVVESVSGNTITVLEGNMGVSTVGRRTIRKGWVYIKGYCRPQYGRKAEVPEDTQVQGDTVTSEQGI